MILPFFRKENTHLKKKECHWGWAAGFGLRVWAASGREGAGEPPGMLSVTVAGSGETSKGHG